MVRGGGFGHFVEKLLGLDRGFGHFNRKPLFSLFFSGFPGLAVLSRSPCSIRGLETKSVRNYRNVSKRWYPPEKYKMYSEMSKSVVSVRTQ